MELPECGEQLCENQNLIRRGIIKLWPFVLCCVEKKNEEFLPLLIKKSTLRLRIDGRGDDYDHYNGCLMVSTVVFVVFEYVASTMLVLWKLV